MAQVVTRKLKDKSLKEKLISTVNKVLINHKAKMTDKIKKVVKKSVKKIVKRTDKQNKK